MKNYFTLLILVLSQVSGFTQGADDLGTNLNIYVYDKDTGKGFPLAFADIIVEIKDEDGNILYTENHQGELDPTSHINLPLGHGMTNDVLTPEILENFHTVCWNAELSTGSGMIFVWGMHDIYPVFFADRASQASDAKKLGGYPYENTKATIPDLLNSTGENNWNIMVNRRNNLDPTQGAFNIFQINDFINSGKVPSLVTGEEVDVVNLGSGLNCAFNFSRTPLPSVANQYTICVNDLKLYNHIAAFINKGIRSSQVTHNTASIYAENNSPDLSAGVLSKAGTWGLFATAINGAVGISNTTANGSGVWGTASTEPPEGGYKYAVLGTTNNMARTWAGAFFGSGFYTGTWSMSSDARFKTEIRSQSHALDKVMKLRPAVYNYRQDTPFGLPAGIHYGFIAQDVEEVLPELVTDIPMPVDLDSQKMHKSAVEEYKGINYIEVISILTSALQELNTTMTTKINAQQEEISELREAIKILQEKK